MTLRTLAVLAFLLPAAAAPAATLWTGGDVSLSYQQFTFGPVSGSFAAAGDLWPDGPGTPAETGVGGLTGVMDGEWLVAAAGVTATGTPGVVDVAVVAVHGEGDALPGPGVWTISPATLDAAFVLVLGASASDIPDELSVEALTALLESVAADHVLVSVGGAIELTTLDAGGVAGVFSGTLLDRDDPLIAVSVGDGVFSLGDGVTGRESLSLGEVKRRWR
ncbi:MAG TPA: hypothetical protein P5571_03425 [Candidatus Krumholzibacteria bacterium]|nr:hypothetical protein [Candidatus Krumholzibacteria bacterium]HRX50390.1 hypothetical protein [Candidatus Krumholzibacteria bacterium]